MSDTVSRKEFEKLKEQVDKISSSTVKKAPRKPSEYNIFKGEKYKKKR